MPSPRRPAGFVLATILPSILVGCVAAGPLSSPGTNAPAQPTTETPLEPGTVMIFSDAAVVEWSDKDASVLPTLPSWPENR